MKRSSLCVLAPEEVPLWLKAIRQLNQECLTTNMSEEKYKIRRRKIFKELKNAK